MCCFHLIESSSFCVSHGVVMKRALMIEGLKFIDVVEHRLEEKLQQHRSLQSITSVQTVMMK